MVGLLVLPLIADAQHTGGSTGAHGMSCCSPQKAGSPTGKAPSPAKADKRGVQKATVTIDGGYSPSSVAVKVGKPVEITFIRKSAAGCDGELVIPDLKFRKSLKPGEKAVVKFTPKKTGPVAFQCGMAMYRGQIAVK